MCDLGCGPGHAARFLGNVGVTLFSLDFSRRMIERVRQLSPDDLDVTLRGIAAFYVAVNHPDINPC